MQDDCFSLTTDDYRLAFCQATSSLCKDVQILIWQGIVHSNETPKCPDAPKKPRTFNQYTEHRGTKCSPKKLTYEPDLW